MSQDDKVDLKKREENLEKEDDEEDEEELKRLEEEKRARKEAVKKRKDEQKRKAEERKRKEKAAKEDDEDEEEIPKPKKGTPAIREEIVNSSVNFLNHPKVKPSPLSQKMAFLQKKGLTQEEIQEALNRASASNPPPSFAVIPTPSSPQSALSVAPPQPYGYNNAPMPYPPPIQQPVLPWYGGTIGFLTTAASCVGAGVGLALLKYLQRRADLEVEKEKEKEEVKNEETKKLADEVAASLKEMQSQNGELRDLLKNFLSQSQPSGQNGSKSSSNEQLQKIEVAELKSEIKKLKAMMLDNRSSNSVMTPNTPTGLKGWSPSSETKLPAWMDKDAKSALSFDDPSIRMLEKAQNRGSADRSTSNSLEEEPRPKDFGRIVQMVQSGQIPDDVKSINDKPLDPNYKVERGQRSAPLKPWQKTSVSETVTTENEFSGPRVQEIPEENESKEIHENGSKREETV